MANDDLKNELEKGRSKVRIRVTYAATGYIFLGALILIAGALYYKRADGFVLAKDIFLAVLPVATGVITYWFATRSKGPGKD